MRRFLEVIERIFTVITLVVYTGGPLVVILSGGLSEGETRAAPDYALVRQLFQVTYIISFLLLMPRWKKGLYLIVKDKLLLLLLGIILTSIAWSTAPQITINRSVAITGTTLFGVYLATRYSLKQQLHLLGCAFSVVMAMSMLFAVVLPKYGIMAGTHLGAWRGIYTHKNSLGAMMTLSGIIFLISAIDAKRFRLFLWGGFGASVCLLFLSRATSPLVNCFVLIIAFFIFRVLRWRYEVRALTLTLLTALGSIVLSWTAQQAEAIAGAFGKDLTLTGRTELWGYAWELIQQRPWLGYGYGALWSSWDSETAYVWRGVGWEAPNAHNGLLELWLGLGFLGLSIALLHFLTNFFRALSIVSQSKTPEYFLPLMLMLYTILVNLTESTFLDRNSIYWVLYVSLILSSQLKSNFSANALLSAPSYQHRDYTNSTEGNLS